MQSMKGQDNCPFDLFLFQRRLNFYFEIVPKAVAGRGTPLPVPPQRGDIRVKTVFMLGPPFVTA